MNGKTLLLGMNNPLSNDPYYDLYPYPAKSTGYRLWKMLPDGTLRNQYLDVFDRRNLLRAREWNVSAARREAQALIPDLVGRFVVVLGTGVRSALGLPVSEPLSVQTSVVTLDTGEKEASFELDWMAFPHPSGRNRWFSDPDNYARARRALALLMNGEKEKLRAES